MKIKILAVLGILVLGTLASAQTFGFASTGGFLYCNYEQLFSSGMGAWSGIDNLSPCGLTPANGAIVGFTDTLPLTGLPVAGAGVTYGDGIYGAEYYDFGLNYYVPIQWTVHTALKCNAKYKTGQYKGKYGWIGVAGSSFGFLFGDNFGFLSCDIPNGNSPTKGLSVGKVQNIKSSLMKQR